MQMKSALFALALTVTAAPLAAQIVVRDPRDPGSRRPTTGGTIGDIIFGDGTVNRDGSCRVRDARTPDGRIVQVCDDRRTRRDDDDDDAYEHRRDGRGRRAHGNDMDGYCDFDARDRAIRKRQKELAKQQRKRGDDWVMSSRRGR